MSVFQEISDYIDTISVIDTHCHKLPRQVGFPAGIQIGRASCRERV